MKPTKIYYEKCFNLGNYENQKVGIEIQLDETDKASNAVDLAKKFVEQSSGHHNTLEQMKYEKCKRIVAEKGDFTYNEVAEAQQYIKEYESSLEDLPF